MKPYVRPARMEDLPVVAANLRQQDREEIRAATGEHPLVALLRSYTAAQGTCWTIIGREGEPVGVFGCGEHEPGVGSVWLVGTDGLPRIAKTFLAQCPQWVAEMHRSYPLLFNYVDARNELHIRWLRWLGFTFIARHEHFGVEQRPFIEFVRTACALNQ